jgi:iron(III) transport system ATP-binding protein
MPESPILQLQQVSRQFDRTTTPAVNQVSLALQSGEILGLLGPSGCGKTTLLRLMAGFESPQTGEIYLAGKMIASAKGIEPPEQRDIGMVFQDYALFPHLTIGQNIAFGLKQTRHKKFNPTQIANLTQSTIGLVGLTGLADRYPHELSGGQQQRVALARAIAPQPAMILLDEPLSNLDVQVRLYLRQEIRNILKTAGTTAIFVTHDQEEALSMCDRVAVMNHGQIEQIGTPELLYQQPASRFVAEFVTQANFLPAQLDLDNHVWQTEIGDLPATSIDRDSSLPTQADLMIRQEDLQLTPDETSRSVVRDRQFLGREYRYWIVTPSGRSLYARTAVKSHGAPNHCGLGDYVRLTVPATAIQVFPCA